MEELIRKTIKAEAKNRLWKHFEKVRTVQYYRKKFASRTGQPADIPKPKLPKQWSFHKHFDPAYCTKHSRFIAKGLWSALQNGTYQPAPSFRVSIPKPSGGFRDLDVFSIPDAAVAKIFHENLRERNAKIFSDSSFAYQIGKTPLDAIVKLKSILQYDTIFISKYDFSQYFDSISHDYIDTLLEKTGPILTTKMERQIIKAVIEHRYETETEKGVRKKGVPQGHSLSLFIANAAAHPLDIQLSTLNGTFARFADDSVVVNTSYEDALKTAEAYHQFSRSSGVAINEAKSSGIRMLAGSFKEMEMRQLSHFDFLSYKFSREGLYLSDRAIAAIKRRCSRIIYNQLLLHLRRTEKINPARIGEGFRDWDLVSCVNELRSYIYGGISQESIDSYLAGLLKFKNISGPTSYYCLVEDSQQFRALDGWLLDCVQRAYKQRLGLVSALLNQTIEMPTAQQFLSGDWYQFSTAVETQLPSFFTSWRAGRKSWTHHGLGGIDPQGIGQAHS